MPEIRPAAALTPAQEAQIGAQADRELRREARSSDEEALRREAQQAATRLAAAFGSPQPAWHIAVLGFAAPNAFALPGGYVYVTRGLFPYLSSESELAAVLAHEMAHVLLGDATADHLAGLAPLPTDLGVFRPVARLFGGRLSTAVPCALFASHDDERERAANARAARALAAAGFDPASLNVVLETLDRLDLDTDELGVPTWGMTHGRGIRIDLSSLPSAPAADPEGRARPAAEPNGKAKPAADDFVERLRGLLFGDDPRIGLVRVDEFTMPNLRIAMTIPDNWDVSSDRTRMIAASPTQDAFLVLQYAAAVFDRPASVTAAASATRAGLRPIAGETTAINGLAAFVGTTGGAVPGLGEARARVACLQLPHGYVVVAGVTGSGKDAEFEPQFQDAIKSVREMMETEAARVRPERIEIETAEPDDTWDSVARRHGGVVMGSMLAILNHASADRPVPAGARIKVVVAAEK